MSLSAAPATCSVTFGEAEWFASVHDGCNKGRTNLHHFLASDYFELFRIYLFPKVWIRWGVKELYLLYNSLLWRLMTNNGNLAMAAIWNAVVGWTIYNTNSNIDNRRKVESSLHLYTYA